MRGTRNQVLSAWPRHCVVRNSRLTYFGVKGEPSRESELRGSGNLLT